MLEKAVRPMRREDFQAVTFWLMSVWMSGRKLERCLVFWPNTPRPWVARLLCTAAEMLATWLSMMIFAVAFWPDYSEEHIDRRQL